MQKVKQITATTLILVAGVAAIGVGLSVAAAGAAIGGLVLLAFRINGALQGRSDAPDSAQSASV